MSGSERRKAPQLSAAQKPQPPLKRDSTEIRVTVSSQTKSDMEKGSIRLFGSKDLQSFARLAIQEKITSMFYQSIPQMETEA